MSYIMELSETVEQPIIEETAPVEQPIIEETAPVEPTSDAPAGPRLVDIEITDQNVALNVMVSFINVAQRRGVFTLDESAKIWECVKSFTVEPTTTAAV